jgi:hypothetical protein
MPKPAAKKQWTDAIPDKWLCDFYYIFFIIFAVFAAISILGGIYIFTTTKMPFSQLIGVFFNIILTGGLSATSALFLYLICDRSLQPNYEGFNQSCEFKDMKGEGFEGEYFENKNGFQNENGFEDVSGFEEEKK